MNIDRIDKGLFRLNIPLGTVTTSVYGYVCEQGIALIDSATYDSDVDGYILPMLAELDIRHGDVKFLLLTHDHFDHVGGLRRLMEIFPDAAVGTSFPANLPNRIPLTDGAKILGSLVGVYLPGHTDHCYGFYDTSTRTLLSGDCLQLDGIAKYRDGIWDTSMYIESINKLKRMGIQRIVAAHEYDPLGSTAEGEQAVEHYLDTCVQIAMRKNACNGRD